jgi:hypothetical protein
MTASVVGEVLNSAVKAVQSELAGAASVEPKIFPSVTAASAISHLKVAA